MELFLAVSPKSWTATLNCVRLDIPSYCTTLTDSTHNIDRTTTSQCTAVIHWLYQQIYQRYQTSYTAWLSSCKFRLDRGNKGRLHTHLTNHGYFDYGKNEDQIEPRAGIKMAQGLVSLVYYLWLYHFVTLLNVLSNTAAIYALDRTDFLFMWDPFTDISLKRL